MRFRDHLMCLLALLFSFSCRQLEDVKPVVPKDGTDFLSFQLKDASGNLYSPIVPITDSLIHIKIPPQNTCSFCPVFSINGERVYDVDSGDEILSDCVYQDFSDFVSPRKYRVVSDSGEDRVYTVVLYDLPVLFLDIPDGKPIESKEERVDGCILRLIDNEGKVNELGAAGVRGRGNSTWDQPKKPYNVKFDVKTPILGMKSSKHWLLLSQPYYDRTQLHNITAFELGHLSDYVWSQSGEFVELVLNGEHKGLFLLSEKIGVESDKINIKSKEFDTCLLESFITGENPQSSEIPDYCFTTDYINITGPWWARRTMAWEIKYPEDVNDQVKQSIVDNLNTIESLLSDDESVSSGLFLDFVDIGSFVDWWLIQEVAANMEASKSKNIFMYFDKDGLLKMGPPWDFDAYAFGQYGDRFTFLCKNDALYFKQLFKNPEFVTMVKEKWARYMPVWKKEIPLFIDKEYELIHRAAERNETMWPDWLNLNKYPEVTYKQLVHEMKALFLEQVEWMDSQITAF